MWTFIHLMKHCFDFKGKASRSEFYFSWLSYIFIGGLLHLCEASMIEIFFDLELGAAARFSLIGFFGVIALYSLSCRRLRDAGYSEKALRWITFPFGPAIAFFISFLSNKIRTKK